MSYRGCRGQVHSTTKNRHGVRSMLLFDHQQRQQHAGMNLTLSLSSTETHSGITSRAGRSPRYDDVRLSSVGSNSNSNSRSSIIVSMLVNRAAPASEPLGHCASHLLVNIVDSRTIVSELLLLCIKVTPTTISSIIIILPPAQHNLPTQWQPAPLNARCFRLLFHHTTAPSTTLKTNEMMAIHHHQFECASSN
jgi:hypothetical protein